MKTFNCYSDLLEMVFPEKLEMFGKKKEQRTKKAEFKSTQKETGKKEIKNVTCSKNRI